MIYGSQFPSLKILKNIVIAKLSVLFDADRSFSSWNRASKHDLDDSVYVDLKDEEAFNEWNFNLII